MNSEIVPTSAIKKRKTQIEAYKDAYEKPNPQVESGFSRRSRKIHRGSKLSQIEIMPEFAFENFQAEPPITALAKIPSICVGTTAQALPSKRKQGSVSKVSPREISVAKSRSEKSGRNYKKIFNDVVNIQDAKFTEEFGETPAVSAICAPKIKSFAAGKKAQTKSKFVKVESVEKSPSFVSDGFRVEPASTVKSANKTKTINDRWLIDAAADELYSAVRVAGKVGKIALKEGFKGAKTGIKAINELSELAVQNPVLIQIGKQHTANMEGMAAGARRARGSILATGNNSRKRHMTAGSLITTHTARTNTGTTATMPNQRVFTHVVHRKGGDIIRYFSAAGIEISAKQAKRLTSGAPLPTADTNEPYNNVCGVVNPVVPNTLGTQRRQGNPIGEITRAGNPLGAIKRVCNPVVDISRVATPSMLVFRR